MIAFTPPKLTVGSPLTVSFRTFNLHLPMSAIGRFLLVTTGRKQGMTISKRELQNPTNAALILINHQPQMAFGVQRSTASP